MSESANHVKRTIIILIGMMFVFTVIFILAFVGLQRRESFLDLGMPVEFENWTIMLLSLASIIKIVWELYNIRS